MSKYSVNGTIEISFQIDGTVDSSSPDKVYLEILRMLTPPGLISSVVRSGLIIEDVGHEHKWKMCASGLAGIITKCLICDVQYNENIHNENN